MTIEQEKDLREMERDISMAERAKIRKLVYEHELSVAEREWLKTCDRLNACITNCERVIGKVKHG